MGSIRVHHRARCREQSGQISREGFHSSTNDCIQVGIYPPSQRRLPSSPSDLSSKLLLINTKIPPMYFSSCPRLPMHPHSKATAIPKLARSPPYTVLHLLRATDPGPDLGMYPRGFKLRMYFEFVERYKSSP